MRTKGEVLTVRDYLAAYVLECTLHHLDLIACLPGARDRGPAPDALAASRAALEIIAGHPFPEAFSDVDALLIGTGRRAAGERERAVLPELAGRLPYVLG